MIKPIALTLPLLILPAQASNVCLTKSEARKLWPTQHLYWYSSDHCWSNRRGKPTGIKVTPEKKEYREPYFHKRALLEAITASAEEPAPKEDQAPWPPQTKPIRVIEIIRPSIPVPVASVETADLSPPSPSPTPPPRKSEYLVVLGGAFSAIFVSFILTRRKSHVKRGVVWICKGASSTGRKILQACFGKRDIEPPIPEGNIRDFIRRVDRGGYGSHPWAVLDRPSDLKREEPAPTPIDDSAVACWARSIRA